MIRRRSRTRTRTAQPSEGARARRDAEAALDDVRKRKAEQTPLRHWFRAQYEANHFGQEVEKLWGGRST